MNATPTPNRQVLSVFVDTSVLFAAAYSATGSARDLIKLAIQGRVMLVISRDVADEVERNLSQKAPHTVQAYRSFLDILRFRGANPPPELIQSVAQYVVVKDAPIIAAAIAAKVNYLVTYDRQHLLNHPEIAQKSGLKIVTPDVVVLEVEKSEDADSETQGI
jgi:putative PIN family toxin of toxin-antitoxin system